MNIYRKIYESHHGKIPVDEFGRSYDIHHIDGDHSNNDISNLKAVTVQEHYDIHYSQGDYAACLLIASQRLEVEPELRSELSRAVQNKKVIEGTHHWLKENGGPPPPNPEIIREYQLGLVDIGSHHFITKEFEEVRLDGYFRSLEKRKANGSFHMITNNPGKNFQFKKGSDLNQQRLAKGTHPSQIKKTCGHCNKTVDSANFARYHGDKCKMKEVNNVD